MPNVLFSIPHLVISASARADEMHKCSQWVADNFAENPPLSFIYGGIPSYELIRTWKFERKADRLDDHRIGHSLSYMDAETGLLLRCVAVEYDDYPIIEWTAYFKNNGAKDTPILESIYPLDIELERGTKGEFVLHHHTGSPCTPRDYEPLMTVLPPSQEETITTSGGRSSNSDFPYFNLEWDNEGRIIVIGWPGQWAARFLRDSENKLRVCAGQELTHLCLHPGEEIRTPLIVIQFWNDDRTYAQNVWRQWMLKHNLPNPPTHQLAACSSHQYGEMINANEANQMMFIDRYLEEGLKLDYWWMDAGWYVNETGWPNTGTWEVDKKRFPNGLRAITDHAHSRGVNIIVWFEPERVTPGTWLYENHPEWLLGADGGQKLLDLGEPEARDWVSNHVDRIIKEQGIDLYRSDYNIDPLPYWRDNDSEERQGITEIKYVIGFLAHWDELRRRHPGMLIDTCASGGRRNDLETLRRSVPLLRSDYIFEPVSQQCHTYGIAPWIPFYGTGVIQVDSYIFYSNMSPHTTLCWDVRNRELDYDLLRRLIAKWRSIGKYYVGDFYQLMPYSLENDVWIAWQFDRPDIKEGMVQAFRRAYSSYESARLKLKGLDCESLYDIIDSQNTYRMLGGDLMNKGLLVIIENQPGATVVTYKRHK